MTAFENATKFFTACEAPEGWPGCKPYVTEGATYDETTRTAIFFAIYHAKHTGEGGSVPPPHKETHSDYVYFLTMNANNKVARMVKV